MVEERKDFAGARGAASIDPIELEHRVVSLAEQLRAAMGMVSNEALKAMTVAKKEKA